MRSYFVSPSCCALLPTSDVLNVSLLVCEQLHHERAKRVPIRKDWQADLTLPPAQGAAHSLHPQTKKHGSVSTGSETVTQHRHVPVRARKQQTHNASGGG